MWIKSKNSVIFVVFLQLISALSASHQLRIMCRFERVGWDDIIGPAYTCNVLELNITEPKYEITKVEGVHPAGTNDNVNTLRIFEQVCEFLPAGTEKFFKNIEGLAVQKSGLKKITKLDLKPFDNLKSISLFGNRLEFLENNLFMYNPKLKLISLFSNQLKHVFSNVLEGLNDLQRIYFSSNVCINEDGMDKEQIEKLKCKLVEHCAVTEDQIERAVLEEEVLKIESENIKLKENLKAVSKSFVVTKRNLEKSERTINTIVKSCSNETSSVAIIRVDLDKCEAEKFDLLELIQELEIVEIVCQGKEQGSTCIADGLKVLKSHIRVVNVKRQGNVQLNQELIVGLIIDQQQTLFLPLNMSHFFPNLTQLSVTRSELITIFGETFQGFKGLTVLDLSNNNLTEVKADHFGYLINLEKIDLSYNKIDFIESHAFNNLQYLTELRVNDNYLVRLSSRYFVMNKNLRILTLNNNKLNEIASNLPDDCCEHLDILDFTNNECIDAKFPETSINEIERNILYNCTLHFDFECKFESKDDYYTCHGQNVVVDSRNIKVTSISGDHKFNFSIENVTALKIEDQSMTFIPLNLGSYMPNLNKFEVVNSKLREVGKETFVGLEKLTQIIIKNNNLRSISEDTFSVCNHLQVLDLSFNSIFELAGDTFAKFTSLNILNLSHNQLEALSSLVIPSINQIEKFIINNNNLTSIDPAIIKLLKFAKLIDFEGNKCIDSTYDQAKNNEKKVMELFGEISFKC